VFWLGVAALEAVLFVIVPNRLHRFVAVTGGWWQQPSRCISRWAAPCGIRS
jgi:hypothetical protein